MVAPSAAAVAERELHAVDLPDNGKVFYNSNRVPKPLYQGAQYLQTQLVSISKYPYNLILITLSVSHAFVVRK